MSQQELDEVDKIIDEIIVFKSVDYSRLSACIHEAKKHFPIGGIKAQYIFHSLRARRDNPTSTREDLIKSLREDILDGHREEN